MWSHSFLPHLDESTRHNLLRLSECLEWHSTTRPQLLFVHPYKLNYAYVHPYVPFLHWGVKLAGLRLSSFFLNSEWLMAWISPRKTVRMKNPARSLARISNLFPRSNVFLRLLGAMWAWCYRIPFYRNAFVCVPMDQCRPCWLCKDDAAS